MAAKFGINDIINAKSKDSAAVTEDYKEIVLSPYEVKVAPENTHRELEGIEELADSFLLVGQEQPTVLAKVFDAYYIIDGHRRNEANIFNLERGHKEYEKVKYRYKEMTPAMYELSLLAGNGFTQPLTDYEKTRLAERYKEALIRAQEEDGLEIKGKMRDLIAAMMHESSTNVARMEKINNKLIPEAKEEFEKGNMGITAAYETAKLPEEQQKEIVEQLAAGKDVRAKEIAQKVLEAKEEKETEYQTPHPESITSLCYSCKNYSTCNVKTGTCEKCDQYINKAAAEKTAEQRYNEEQDAIDKEVKKRQQEQAREERLDNQLNSKPEQKIHEIKIAKRYYKDVISGRKRFELRKNDRDYKVGDRLKMLEFTDGKFTGRTIDAEITYMLEEYTGLQEDYCILGIELVSDSDTEKKRTVTGTDRT